jgi:flagellar basal body-associated protein FliL
MASSTSFKQQCPSCEAMVPIRDPALVGRKIDCPKCKYRFVVEKPEEEEDDDSSDKPAPTKKAKNSNGVQGGKPAAVKGKRPALRRRDEDEDEEDERPQKKKSGASTTVILGGVLGLLALGLLAVGAMFAFGVFGGSTKPDSSSNSGSSSSSNNSGPQAATENASGAEGAKETPAASLREPDISNLLPNDSEAVFNYQIDKLSSSSFRDAALQTSGAFNEAAFKNTFGFPLYDSAAKDGVKRVVTAVNNSKHWVFTAVRTMKPINRENLIQSLGLEALPEVNKLTAYSVKHDLDSLSNLLIKANRPHDDLQVCIFDGQTLVFADPAPMAKFLADGGRPKQLSESSAAAPSPPAANTPGGSSMPPGGSSMAPGGSSMPSGGSSMRPGGSSMPPSGSSMPPGGSSMPAGGSSMPPGMGSTGGAAPSTPAPAPAAGSYLTINPGMKAVFDKLDKPDSPTLLSIVLPVKDPLLPEFGRYIENRRMTYLSAKGERAEDSSPPPSGDAPKSAPPVDRVIRLVGFSLSAVNQERISATVAAQFANSELAKAVAQGVEMALNSAASAAEPTGDNTPNGFNRPNGVNPPPPPPMLPGFLPPGFMPARILPPHFLPPAPMQRPPGFGGSFPGGSAPPGGSLPPGMSRPPNGFSPPPGGSSAVGDGPPSPGGFGQSGSNPMAAGPSPLTFGVENDVAFISLLSKFEGEDESQALNRELGQFMIYLKGDADLASSGSRIHDLAGALQKFVKEKGHFPRGTADRPQTADLFADWAPDQRVSWMAELLPYLGEGEYAGLQVDPKKSWQEGDNLNVAGIVIPQFLARSSAAASPRVQYPGVPPVVAMTNYVGVAGVGLDAAEYAPGNPNAGVFGYYRETKPADVKRGLDKTIALLQVPAEELTPWLAGGGATVRGVSDGPDAVKPFVCTEYQGKRGTFAVMGDGKVRFIPETIDPKIFRTLCLITGGEKIENLDKIAPIVAGDGQPELKATAPPVAAK